MTGPKGEKCEACYFFTPDGDVKSMGYCHRYPPKIQTTRIYLEDDRDEIGFEEPVSSWQWCGEYQARITS